MKLMEVQLSYLVISVLGLTVNGKRYNCPKLELENGRSYVRQSGRLVKYKCMKSYTLVGMNRATCLPTGRWSDPPPRCTAAELESDISLEPTMDAERNTENLPSSTALESTVRTTPTASWTVKPTKSVTNKETAKQKKRKPKKPRTKKGKRCQKVNIRNGAVTVIVIGGRQQAKYKCNLGYKLVGYETAWCRKRTGTWKLTPPLCVSEDSTTTMSIKSLPMITRFKDGASTKRPTIGTGEEIKTSIIKVKHVTSQRVSTKGTTTSIATTSSLKATTSILMTSKFTPPSTPTSRERPALPTTTVTTLPVTIKETPTSSVSAMASMTSSSSTAATSVLKWSKLLPQSSLPSPSKSTKRGTTSTASLSTPTSTKRTTIPTTTVTTTTHKKKTPSALSSMTSSSSTATTSILTSKLPPVSPYPLTSTKKTTTPTTIVTTTPMTKTREKTKMGITSHKFLTSTMTSSSFTDIEKTTKGKAKGQMPPAARFTTAVLKSTSSYTDGRVRGISTNRRPVVDVSHEDEKAVTTSNVIDVPTISNVSTNDTTELPEDVLVIIGRSERNYTAGIGPLVFVISAGTVLGMIGIGVLVWLWERNRRKKERELAEYELRILSTDDTSVKI